MKLQYFHVFHNCFNEQSLFKKRIFISSIIMLLLIIIILTNLYYLQIVNFDDYYKKSQTNHIKNIPISPYRGSIYDRNGIILAYNKTFYKIEVIPNKIYNIHDTIAELRNIIDLTEQDIENFYKTYKQSYDSNPISLKYKLNEMQLAKFSVNQFRFPGIKIKSYQCRYYPYGETLTHVLGYVSKIDYQDKQKLNKNGILQNYNATKNIGKLGIERYYEKFLHGKTGYKQVEVNNKGQVIRQLYKKLPESGLDLVLTIDLKLQQYIKKLLNKNRASVIVLDPRDASIQALVSNPSYDPNLFVHGVSNKYWNNLLKNKNFPLLNRTIQGIYPPASTVKPYILLSALTIGTINTNFSLFDPGWWQLPNSKKLYRDWKKSGHGKIDIINALEESSDTFFYQIAYDMGIDKLSEWMFKFGFGQYSGIDICEESIGNMPTKMWKIKKFKQPWYIGDTISVGIGQGYWTATPIQISKALITLINNGVVKTPHLLDKTLDKHSRSVYHNQEENKKLNNITSNYWQIVKYGMFKAAHNINGTVYNYFIDSSYKIAAKSGTAQLYNLKNNENYKPVIMNKNLRDHKLMTAFAPYENPTIALVIVLENGGNGLTTGKITRSIFDYMLLNKN